MIILYPLKRLKNSLIIRVNVDISDLEIYIEVEGNDDSNIFDFELNVRIRYIYLLHC